MNSDYLNKSIKLNDLERKKIQKKRHVNDKILNIVRKFIIDKKLVCYKRPIENHLAQVLTCHRGR